MMSIKNPTKNSFCQIITKHIRYNHNLLYFNLLIVICDKLKYQQKLIILKIIDYYIYKKVYIMDKKYKGIVYIVTSAFCFAFMNLFVRLAGDLPSVEKSFFRNFVAVFFAAAMLIKNKSGFLPKKGNMKYLILRAGFGTLGILCNFYAIDHLVLADASILNKMSPFFVIFFSFLILKEKLTFIQGSAVVIAFIGSLFIIKPSFQNIDLIPSLMGLIGGICAGFAYTMVRVLGQKGENGSYIVFFFSAFSCISTLPFLIFNFVPMEWWQLLCLFGAGLSATGGQFSITSAYYYAPAKEISVYDYSQIIFSTLLGFIFFGEIPDMLSVVGYIIICAMAVYMFMYNNKRGFFKEKNR